MGCYTDICGEWNDEPTTPKGQCTPRRLKSDCGLTVVYGNEPQTVTLTCPEGSITGSVSYTVEADMVSSPFSVDDANETALAQAQAGAEALRAASPCLYANSEQTCEDECPEGMVGDTISVTIPAGSFTRETQEAADAAALAEACAQVAELREASPCEEPPPPEEEPGSLWGWGWNFFGNLGTQDNADKWIPTVVGVDEPEVIWVQISGNETFSMGRKSDGTLWSWGANFFGELGHGTRSISPSTAYHRFFPTQIGSDTDWIDFACGDNWAIAVKSGGGVYTWGINSSGQLGHGDTTLRTSPTLVSGVTGVACGASADTAFVIKDDGTLWSCGEGSQGELGDGVLHDINVFAQVGVATNWLAVAGSTDPTGQDTIGGLRTDGSVYGWGVWDTAIIPSASPATLLSAGPFDSMGVGNQFMIVRQTDGTLWSIGSNAFGQLGIGSLTDVTEFTQIGSDIDWEKVAVGAYHALGLKTGGTIYGWGADGFGNLGQATLANDRQVPVQIGPDEFWTDIFASASQEGCSFGLRSVTTEPPPPAGISGVATGGVVSIDGGYHIHRFDYTSGFTVLDGLGVSFDILIVGAGGCGGGLGGGGCGEFVKQVGVSLSNGSYPVTVGNFTTAGGGGTPGGDGGPSSFNGTTALGGGGGGAFNDDGSEIGKNGAGGGGGGVTATFGPAAAGGTGSPEGNGGTGAFTSDGIINGGVAGGGGGGAAANGANGATDATTGTGGAGGAGTSDSITGSAVTYAAGGGGGGTTTGGAGGSSVGGKGGNRDTTVAAGEHGKTPGSGGGGGAREGVLPGGFAGRGVVIIRYLSPP